MMFQPQSDLSGALEVLVCVFGEEPPVFAKSQSQPSAATQASYKRHTAGYTPRPTSGHPSCPFILMHVVCSSTYHRSYTKASPHSAMIL